MSPSLRPPLFGILLGLSFWLSQELIYEPLVVPHLAGWKEVPTVWWLAVFAPEIVVCIGATFFIRHARDAIVFCVLGGLVVSACQFFAGLANQPAHYKVIEGGLFFFAMQFFIITLLLLGLVGFVSLIRVGVGRIRLYSQETHSK